MMRRLALLGALCVLPVLNPQASAEGGGGTTEYKVTLAGFTVAGASFVSRIDNNAFTINGRIKARGVADLFTDFDATADVRGVVRDGRLAPAQYALAYKKGKKRRKFTVAFDNGNVTSSEVVPSKRRPKDWVDVEPAHLVGVADPISGLILPPNEGACPKQVSLFDGETRMELTMSFRYMRKFSAAGYKGEAAVCSVNFKPEAGYKKSDKDMRYLADSSGMEIWFARTASGGAYAPVYVDIPTRAGSLVIRAVRFEG
jgi:hypothetical protein